MSHQFSLYLLLMCPLLGYLELTSGQIPSSGKCPGRSTPNPVDVRKLIGHWFEIEASPLLSEWPYRCISIKVASFYEKKAEVAIEGINRFSSKLEVLSSINAVIPETTDGKDGKLIISTLQGHKHFIHENMTVQILASDYEHWALVSICKDHEKAKGVHTELLWILSRQRELDTAHYQAVRDMIVALHLESIPTRQTIQTLCTPGEGGGKKRRKVLKTTYVEVEDTEEEEKD